MSPDERLRKMSWIERVQQVELLHQSKLRENIKWIIEDTAKLLNRSRASVSDDLILASWLKTHSKQLERLSSISDALEFVREKKRQMRLGL